MISLAEDWGRLSRSARRAPGCFTERVHHFAVVPDPGLLRVHRRDPDIHSLYRVVETVTED